MVRRIRTECNGSLGAPRTGRDAAAAAEIECGDGRFELICVLVSGERRLSPRRRRAPSASKRAPRSSVGAPGRAPQPARPSGAFGSLRARRAPPPATPPSLLVRRKTVETEDKPGARHRGGGACSLERLERRAPPHRTGTGGVTRRRANTAFPATPRRADGVRRRDHRW